MHGIHVVALTFLGSPQNRQLSCTPYKIPPRTLDFGALQLYSIHDTAAPPTPQIHLAPLQIRRTPRRRPIGPRRSAPRLRPTHAANPPRLHAVDPSVPAAPLRAPRLRPTYAANPPDPRHRPRVSSLHFTSQSISPIRAGANILPGKV